MIRPLLYLLTGRLPCRIIADGDRPYLERYYLGQILGWTFYLHRFVDSDPGRGLHDHPWRNAFSLVLAGAYLEETRTGTRRVRWLNRLTGDSFHRVVLPAGSRHVWTLFCHGAWVKPWGFLKAVEISHAENILMWVPSSPGKTQSPGPRWWRHAPKGKHEPRRQPA